MKPTAASAVSVEWHHGPRALLRELFDLADDSREQATAQPGVLGITSLAVPPPFRRRVAFERGAGETTG